MNITDKACQIDLKIQICEKKISRLIDIILDLIETGHNADEEERVYSGLNERLLGLQVSVLVYKRCPLPFLTLDTLKDMLGGLFDSQ